MCVKEIGCENMDCVQLAKDGVQRRTEYANEKNTEPQNYLGICHYSRPGIVQSVQLLGFRFDGLGIVVRFLAEQDTFLQCEDPLWGPTEWVPGG